MIIPQRTKPEAACAGKHDGRSVLRHVSLAEGRLVASDAYIAVSIPVELDESDTDGVVPTPALAAARRGNHRIALNGTADVEGVAAFYRPEVEPYPYTKTLAGHVMKDDIVFEVAVNVDLLARCAKALGDDQVVLRFQGELRPILVEPLKYNHDDRWGLIMPIRISKLHESKVRPAKVESESGGAA